MKIATWNVNSVNKRLNLILDFMKKENPDILCLQELKTNDSEFPYFDFQMAGYNSSCFCESRKNGVAVISKFEMQIISRGLGIKQENEEARFISVNIPVSGKILTVSSVYVPVGGFKDFDDFTDEDYCKWNNKLSFLRQLYSYIKKNPQDIIAGDFNMVSKPEDISDKSKQNFICCSPKEIKIMSEFEKLGYDNVGNALKPHGTACSWWGYQSGPYVADSGLRLDHIFCARNKFTYSDINIKKKQWRDVANASDHAPVILECELL